MCLESKPGNSKTLSLINQGYQILAEYQLVEQEQLRGIYAIPSYSSCLLWFGVIFIHSGCYAESVFRFSILLPDQFPNERTLPTVIFQQDIFHPHICPISHSLDLRCLLKDWVKDEHHIWHILKYIQAIFADPEGSIIGNGVARPLTELNNFKAFHLLSQNRIDYVLRVRNSILWSCKHMFDKPPIKDPHYIVLERYLPHKHLAVMKSSHSQ
ncbi:protein crossbronx-like [Drosophila grimshawi]|uniref:Protein crossbronx-like n=1 Tax=Drosophila grimshawi TaxID=7222 RepID=AKTP2_DROGR|nr:protein crossbronx-like [Drosophila grimshawi]B4JWF5.1 RecName: Full=Protein crossbronx-like [Drosophila grimshawi]EDV98293.1 GH22748 [Drosophila grimshawi]